MALSDMQTSEYIKNIPYKCSCGKIHRCDIDEIVIKKGALDEAGGVLDRLTGKTGAFDKARDGVFMLADENTYRAAGAKTEDSIRGRGYKINKLILPGDRQVVPDEKTVFKVLNAIGENDGFIAAVGSGTINDMCRYLSFKLKIPYMIVATAPSMDGFASSVAPLVVNNIKTTYNAVTPRAIIGDIDVLKEAPHHLIAAGLGDILGKYDALCDWKNSSLATGEEYCPEIAGMVEEATKKCERSAAGLHDRDESSIRMLMEALILTGISISFWGYSRPASSAEHHLAHFWEMSFLFEGREAVLHGAKVGIASVIAAYLQSKFAVTEIDFDRAIENTRAFDFDVWADGVREQFRDGADEIIERERESGFYLPENRIKRIEGIRKNLPAMIETIKKYTPSEDGVRELLKKAGGPSSPGDVGISRGIVHNSIIHAKEIRPIVTILQTLSDCCLLEEFAAEAAGRFSPGA